MPVRKIPEISLEYYLIAFDAEGHERDESGIRVSQEVLNRLQNQDEPITDVFLISHGWLGDVPAAYHQYDKWITAMATQKADLERMRQVRPQFRPLLIGLHWPSKPWGNESLELDSRGASFDGVETLSEEEFIDQYAQILANTEPSRQALKRIFQATTEGYPSDTLPPDVRQAYEILNQEAGLGDKGAGAAPGIDREGFDPDQIYEISEEDIAGSRGVNVSWDGILAPLRMLSFWKMKDRARHFGEGGAFKLLTDLQQVADAQVRFHLMGHSFGCIVVSGMLAGPNGDNRLVQPVNSLALVQGALSLWSYCSDMPVQPGSAGYFRSLIANQKVNGPIITTQSEFDTAIRILYPIGAGVRQEIDFSRGELPKYGGLGTFGAQGPGLNSIDWNMLSVQKSYEFKPGTIYNLDGSPFICDGTGGGLGGAHSDIAKPEVAHAVWSAAFGY